MKRSHIVALLMAVGITAWMATGNLVIGGNAKEEDREKSIAARNQDQANELFKVSYKVLEPQQRQEIIRVRGRTRADAIIPIRAETAGILEERLVNKGDRVESGQLVCSLDSGARRAKLAEAESRLRQAEADYESNSKLIKKGFASKNRGNQLFSELNTAKSAVEQAKLELSRVEIRANASGIVQDPIAEVGDMLSIGAACVTLIDTDPMMFTGQVSERDIGKVLKGMQARLELVDGEQVEGKVTYISPSSDPNTRTFAIEVKLAPSTNTRDGMTASAELEMPPTQAYRVSPSWLVLNDEGEVGLKVLDTEDRVTFVPADIVSQTRDGFWINGLKPGSRVIVLGQNFVKEGIKVEPVAVADDAEEDTQPAETGEQPQANGEG